MSSFPAKPRNSLNAGLFAAIRKRLESSGIASNSDALNSLSRFPRHVSSLADSAKLEGFDDDLVISACTEFFRAQSLCTDHSLSEVVLIEDSDDDDFVVLDKGSVYPPASVATATSPIVLSDSDVLESAPLAQRLKHKHGLNSPVGKHAAAAVAAAAPLVAKNQSTTRVIEDDSDSDFGSSSVDKGLSRVAVSLGPSVSRTLSSSSNASGGVFDLPRPAGAQPSRVSHFTKPVISASSLSSLNRSASLTGTAAATAAAAAAASAPTRSASSAAAQSSGGCGSSGGISASQMSSSRAGRIEGPTAWSCPCCHRGFTLPLSPVDSGWTVDPSQPGGMPPTRPASCAAPAGSSLASSSSISSSAPVSVSAPPPHTCALDVACWEVVLLLDNREVRSQKDRGYMAAELQGRGVTVEVRALALGDIMWIARRREGAPRPVPPPHLLLQQQQQAKGDAAAEADAVTGASSAQAKPPKPRAKKAKKGDASSSSSEALGPVDDAPTAALKPSARRKKVAPAPAAAAAPSDCEWSWDPRPVRDETREWVLDAIIERKSVGDLAASIVDGRYIEQKTRLAESGLRVIYLVEGDPHKLVDNAGYGPRIGSKHIASAMVSTQVGNGFRVVSTHTLDATIAWLVKMHFTFVAAFNNGAKCEFARAAAGALSPPSSSSSSAVSSSSSSSSVTAPAAPVRSSSSTSGGVFASQSQSASQLQMHGDGGGAWSDGFALSQAAASASLALADPWCLIGGGERGGSGATTSSSSGSNAAAAVASAAAVLSYSDQQQLQHQQRHVCAYDRCALLGRPSLPRRLLPRSYAEHHTLASRPKVFTAMQLFGRMLRQVNGCSADRAHAVLALYPTPATLAAAFDALPQRDGPALLRNLPIPRQRKVIGPALSATLHDVFNSRPTAAAVSKRGPDASGSSSSSGGGGADTGFSERRLGSEDGDDDDDEEENEL